MKKLVTLMIAVAMVLAVSAPAFAKTLNWNEVNGETYGATVAAHAFADNLRRRTDHSLMFASALRRAGVPFELHIYPFGVHGLSLATKAVEQPEKKRLPDPHVAGWIDACGEWIQQMLDRA